MLASISLLSSNSLDNLNYSNNLDNLKVDEDHCFFNGTLAYSTFLGGAIIGGGIIIFHSYLILGILLEIFNALASRIQSWQKWRIVAKVLVEKKLMKPSQISWQLFLFNFLIHELEIRLWTTWLNWPYPQLSKLQSFILQTFLQSAPIKSYLTSTPMVPMLPRPACKWEKLEQSAIDHLDANLLPPLTSIIKEYEPLPPSRKINLLTTNLEDCFTCSSSGTIDLRLVYSAHPGNTCSSRLRIFYHDDPLLVTIPTAFINSEYDAIGMGNLFDSSDNLFILNTQGALAAQLVKNLNFLNSLWEKLHTPPSSPTRKVEEIEAANYTYDPFKFPALTNPELRSTNSMKEEFQTATFVVNDIILNSNMQQIPFARLLFVAVE